jgi:hypothetical protein
MIVSTGKASADHRLARVAKDDPAPPRQRELALRGHQPFNMAPPSLQLGQANTKSILKAGVFVSEVA